MRPGNFRVISPLVALAILLATTDGWARQGWSSSTTQLAMPVIRAAAPHVGLDDSGDAIAVWTEDVVEPTERALDL